MTPQQTDDLVLRWWNLTRRYVPILLRSCLRNDPSREVMKATTTIHRWLLEDDLKVPEMLRNP